MDTANLKLVLVVNTSPTRRYTFEGRLRDGLSTDDLRRLWEAERALNDLTDLRVHVDIMEEAGSDDGGHDAAAAERAR